MNKQKRIVHWINFLAHREKQLTKENKDLKKEVKELHRKLHILGKSVLKLYKKKKK